MQNKTLTEYWTEAKDYAERRRERGEPEFPTGLAFLDEATDGLHKGEVWIIAGKSGAGKTSLALGLSKSFGENPDHSILFSSLEMKGQELTTRLFCDVMDEDYDDFTKGIIPQGFEKKDKVFRNYLKSINLEIAEFLGYRFEEIQALIEEGYAEKKPDVLFIDHIQQIDKAKFFDERHAIMEYMNKLKELAKKENLGIVVVSQLRRLPSGSDYNREPDIMDLLGTSCLETIADKIILVYKAMDKEKNIHHFIKLAKNRQGIITKQEVIFEGEHYRFRERTSKEIEEVKKTFQGERVE